MSCVSLSSSDRPTMRDLVAKLRECLKIAMAHERTNGLEDNHDSISIEAVMDVEERYIYLSKMGKYSLGCSIHGANPSLFDALLIEKHTPEMT